MSDRDVRKLAKIVADHSRQIKGLSGGPQAAYSSIEGGSMDAYDNDGKMRLRIGAQDDGTHAVKYVQGPPPPRPTAPAVSVDGPVVRVRWDGMLMGGHIPEDFARIDVHFALASDDLEAEGAVRGNLATSAGNETVLAATQTGTYRVGLVAMSQSRARSEMSEVVDVDVTLVDIEGALDAVVENARGGSNYYSPEPPSGTDHDPDRDLWFDTSVDAEGLVSYSPHRWDADLLEWVSVADQRTAALQDALGDFEGTVEQRFTDADTAIDGLRDSLTNLDETTLPALRQDLDAAEGRLGEAEGQITDAFGQLEVIPGQISDAQQAAIDAAAQDAEIKANAAQQAAQEHADLVAQGAEDDAIAAAETRAQELADAAQQAAEQSAQTKADAARDAAISDAEGKISAARQEAIDAAAADAQVKADAAQQAAEEKAATAQQAADDALAAINAGESMWADPGFENGYGPLGSTNSAVNRSQVHAYQGAWSVEYTTTGTGGSLLPGYVYATVTPGRTYRLSAAVRSDDGLVFESWFQQRTASGTIVVQQPTLQIPGGVGSWALGDAIQTIADGVVEVRFAPMAPASHNNVAGQKLYLDNFALTDITEAYAMFRDAMDAATDAQTVAGEAKAIAEAAVGAAQGGNTNFFNPSPPSGVGSLVGDMWWQRDASNAIVGLWRWDGTNWVRQTMNNEVIGNLDAGKISFGYMDGDRIRAGSIYADRIISGLSQNMVPDPGFVSDEISAQRISRAELWGSQWSIEGGIARCDATAAPLTGNPALALAATDDREAWPAYPEMQVVFRYMARVTGGSASVRGTAFLKRRDGSRTYVAMNPSSWRTVGSEWAEYSFTYALGADIASYSTAIQVRSTSTGIVEFTAPFSASTVGTTVIEDGAVTTGKLRADVMEVGNLKAGTGEIAELVSRKIAAATGQFLELDVGQLTVTEQSRLADVVAEQIAADTAQFMELEVGKLVASEGILDEAVIKQLFAEVVVSQMSFADSFIGGNAILEGSITAESGIIGSLDLGVAIVGKLHGQYVEAGSIDTEQLAFGAATGDVLSLDALNFKTAVGLDIRGSSFRAGDAVEMTEDFGIRQFGPGGALNVSLPSDGSPAEFRGDLSARTLTATGRMSIQGPGAIASGGVLELESGVVPPVGPPSVSNSLQTTKFPPVADDESVWGLAWAGGSWWRGINKRAVVVGDRIERISPTGELEASFSTGVNPQGLTSIGDELFLLGTKHANSQGTDQVLVYSLTGTLKRRWEYPNYGTGTHRPGIGTDGTNILIAQPWQDGRLTWRRFNKTTGALLAQVDSDRVRSSSINAITQTVGDFGKQQVVITWGDTSGANEVYETNGTYVPQAGWLANHQQEVKGTVFKDGHFYHITAGGDLVKMSDTRFPNGEPGVDTDDWWAAITWSDGTYETTLGPARQFMNRRRYDTRVSFGSPPDGATVARVYFARGVTEPSRTSFHRVGEVGATAEQSIIVQPIGWESLANPPASNSFPQSTPGLIRSGIGQFEVDGTGAGRWGPLTFHADGSMTSDQVPEWVPVTTFASGYGPQTWGFVPAYRIWPDGKVEWRGVVAGTINGTVTPFTIPAEARPAQPVNKAAAASGSGGTSLLTRIEFGSEGDPDKLRVYRGDSDRTWVSLDDTSYYLV